jgi:hypothetical protein
VQEQFLFSLLQAYRDTELGRKYKLGEIKTIDSFAIAFLFYLTAAMNRILSALPKVKKIF